MASASPDATASAQVGPYDFPPDTFPSFAACRRVLENQYKDALEGLRSAERSTDSAWNDQFFDSKGVVDTRKNKAEYEERLGYVSVSKLKDGTFIASGGSQSTYQRAGKVLSGQSYELIRRLAQHYSYPDLGAGLVLTHARSVDSVRTTAFASSLKASIMRLAGRVIEGFDERAAASFDQFCGERLPASGTFVVLLPQQFLPIRHTAGRLPTQRPRQRRTKPAERQGFLRSFGTHGTRGKN